MMVAGASGAATEHIAEAEEQRAVVDGKFYTYLEFKNHYGSHALRIWNERLATSSNAHAHGYEALNIDGATEHIAEAEERRVLRWSRRSVAAIGNTEHLEVCRATEQTAVSLSLVLGDDTFIRKVVCLLGFHRDDSRGTWTAKRHWGRQACGQSCGCCCAHEMEDYHDGCEACCEMWLLTTVNRQWRDRSLEFDGVTESYNSEAPRPTAVVLSTSSMVSAIGHAAVATAGSASEHRGPQAPAPKLAGATEHEAEEVRTAADSHTYTYADFIAYYGKVHGPRIWEDCQPASDTAQAGAAEHIVMGVLQPATNQADYVSKIMVDYRTTDWLDADERWRRECAQEALEARWYKIEMSEQNCEEEW